MGWKYRVEQSANLNEWSALTSDVEATGDSMSYVSEGAVTERSKFYRVAAQPEDFDPASLQPLWQLDAQNDFPAEAEGKPVAQWNGKGVSAVQAAPGQQPVLRNGAVIFDGNDDLLSIPMWSQGVGTEWTLAVLMKVRKDIQDYRMPFGGDFGAKRAMEFFYLEAGICRWVPNWEIMVNQENYAFAANDEWKILIVRSDGTHTKVALDWAQNSVDSVSPSTGATGNFNIGGSYDASTAAAVNYRYLSFIPRCISDEETAKLTRWLDRKKGDEHPPVMLIYGGGQSNFLTTKHELRKTLISEFDNVALSFGEVYGGRPLTMWERDKDDGSGFEICPQYDLSAAPANSMAAYQIGTHSGYPTIADWQLRESVVKKNPKTLIGCFFIQGETDVADARDSWKPNGDGLYNLSYSDPDALAKSYGPRATAWNAAIREKTGHPDMFFIYERLAFDVEVAGKSAADINRLNIQHKGLTDALKVDPRWFLIDVADMPREDGVHLTRTEYQKDQIPNTGAERFARAGARLLRHAERLSQLPYDARMLAMRMIAQGKELDEAGIQACITLTNAPGFKDLRSLVIPGLAGGANDVEQDSLRRCNLLVHLGDLDPVSFVSSKPTSTVVEYANGADAIQLQASIRVFALALGVAGDVSMLSR